MEKIERFIQFLRNEKGLYYFKIFMKHKRSNEVESVLNSIACTESEEDLRCLEHLWKSFVNGETNVNAALWKPRKQTPVDRQTPILSVDMKDMLEKHYC